MDREESIRPDHLSTDGGCLRNCHFGFFREGIGVGNALIEAVKERARAFGRPRLWLVTTNAI